jgi:quercetin dioxygenase-like cupin family protein
VTPTQTSETAPPKRTGDKRGILLETGSGATLDLEDLLSHAAAGKPLHVASETNSGDALPLFDWDELKSVAQTRAGDPDHWRFYKKGCRIDPVLLRLVDGEGRLRDQSIELLLKQAGTVRLDRLDLRSTRIRIIADHIKQATGARVRSVAMASGGPVHGMPKHYDPVDVIAIQTAGRKTWDLFGKPVPGSGVFGKADSQPEDKSASIDLAQGDILFVPSGLHHRCLAREPSLHIAFTLKWPTLLEIRGELPDQTENPEFKEPLRFFGGEQELLKLALQMDRRSDRPLSPDRLEQGVRAWLDLRDTDAPLSNMADLSASAVGFAG